ncbi:hypothetical protein BC826DRAFT_996172, partial [Russula brevipes]
MLKIPMSLNLQEIQRVSERADDLRYAGDRADSHVNSHIVSPPPLAGLSPKIEEGSTDPQVCNSCSEPILTIRYQCLNCPSIPFSFNLCSECEVKSWEVHDPMHVFLKIPRPVDIPGPLESESPFIPILYQFPAGPDADEEPRLDPQAYLRKLVHHFALCDLHMTRIVGKWYRCAFCAKDLCADCEAFDTHDDSTHAFLVLKSPVSLGVMRQLVGDLSEPAAQMPILRGKIYYPRH